MKEIILHSISTGVSWQMEKREMFFMYSYFFKFFVKNENHLSEYIIVELEELNSFLNLFESALNELIIYLYQKPSEKDISKHPTRYERFIFNNKKYIVNYTTSITGRLMYILYLRIEFIRDEIGNLNANKGIKISLQTDQEYW
jgi:hypothetical protein